MTLSGLAGLAALDAFNIGSGGTLTLDPTVTLPAGSLVTFTDANSTLALGNGINLAELATPMTRQAGEVHKLTLKHNNLHKLRWRSIQVPYQTARTENLARALEGLDGIENEMVAEQHAMAQPKPHKFALKPKS